MPTCQLCRKEKKLIHGHIIPEAYYDIYQNQKGVNQLIDMDNKKSKSFPKGVYDSGILCADCV